VHVRARALFGDPSAAASRIDPETIAQARREGTTLGAVIDRQAGARVLDEGGPLHAERVTVRGGSAAETQVVIDGVALVSPFATGLDVGLIGVESVARATLVRGGAGALYGDGALTGALTIETRTPEETPPLTLGLRAGSQDRFGLSAVVRASDLAIGADVDRTSGRFDYVSRIEGLPDAARVRENNDASLGRAHARGGWALAGGALTLLAGGVVREGGSPGLETSSDLDARERRAHGIARVAWQGPLLSGATWEIAAQGSALNIDYDDPDPDAPLSSRTTFVSGGGDTALAWRWGDHRLRIGAGGAVETSRSTEHGAPTRGRGHVVVSDELVLDDLRLFAAVRGALVDEAVVLPRIGAVWTATTGVAITAAIGRSFRAPAIDELYHPLIRGFSGNPNLVPETAWEAELGVRLWVLSIAGYARRIEDIIVYVNQNAFLVRPENLGGASAIGVEVELAEHASIGPLVLDARFAASIGASRLDASGASVPVASPYGIDAELRASLEMLSAFTRIAHGAPTTANLAGTIPVDGYTRWDAGVVWTCTPGASLGLVVTNLLDDQTLETLFKLPLPGRSMLATLRVEAG